MADVPDRYYVRVRAKALINGEELPLQSFSVNYVLNDIPTAELEIALGRGMSGPGKGKVSSGWGMLSSIKPFTPVEIKINLEAENGKFSGSDEDDGLKQGTDQTIFKGFLFTPSQSKDRLGSSASLLFQAIGAPAAIAGTTQFAVGLANTKPDKAGNSQIVARLGAANTKLSNIDVFIKQSSAINRINDFVLDLYELIAKATGAFSLTDNRSALSAINRMRGYPLGTSTIVLEFGPNINARYWQMAMARFYAEKILGKWRNPESGADLWAVLREITQSLLVHIVPAIEHDAMAPITLGLGGQQWRTYNPSDYWGITLTPDPFTPEFYSYVGKVGMYMPSSSYSLLQEKLEVGKTMGYADLDKKFDTSLGETIGGKAIIIRTPQFLLCPGPSGPSTGLGGTPTPDAADPRTFIQEVKFGDIITVFMARRLGDDFCRCMLHDKIFAHRKGVIVGRFRLDIAPGSLLKIKTIGERFVGEVEVFYGHAYFVTLRGGNGRMETQVGVVSIRTETEHEQFTVPEHPLYQTRWAGAKLTD